MNRDILLIGGVFILLASACAPQATPTANPVDIGHTAEAAALTMVAETQAAAPTTVPPTETASPTQPPTSTSLPLPTSGTPGTLPANAPTTSTTLSASFTQQAPPTQPQSQPTSSSGGGSTQDVCNQPLTSWQGPTANFSIANQTQPEGTIVLSMYVVTDLGQCGYLIITGDSFSGPIGNYSAGAFITGKQNFKAFGTFRITEGNWSIVVKNDSIEARGGCYPNC
jgi:hypothetical protein